MRSFKDCWNTSVPSDLQQNIRKGYENNKPLLNQIYYALLQLHLSGNHDSKPSHRELKNWLVHLPYPKYLYNYHIFI